MNWQFKLSANEEAEDSYTLMISPKHKVLGTRKSRSTAENDYDEKIANKQTNRRNTTYLQVIGKVDSVEPKGLLSSKLKHATYILNDEQFDEIINNADGNRRIIIMSDNDDNGQTFNQLLGIKSLPGYYAASKRYTIKFKVDPEAEKLFKKDDEEEEEIDIDEIEEEIK